MQDAGTLVVGNSSGTTTIAGDYALSSGGMLEVELTSSGGVAGVDFDLLDITGNAVLGGTLDILFQNGFTPSAGDRFEVLTAASVFDTFDTLNLPTLPGDLLWFVNYNVTSVELVSSYAADFNEDGMVDDTDLAAWESGFGSSSVAHANGDANGDAFTDGSDFLTWQRQFTSGVTPPFTSSTSIPEPNSVLLLVAVAATMILQYRNRLS